MNFLSHNQTTAHRESIVSETGSVKAICPRNDCLVDFEDDKNVNSLYNLLKKYID